MRKENQFKHKIIGLKLLNEKLKGLEVIFDYNEDKDGRVLGMLEGVKKMSQSNKKITNQDIMNLLTKKFEAIDKRFEDMETKFEKRFEDMETKFEKRFEDMNKDMNKRFDKIDAKIDLIIACPTIQSEIDHEALAKIEAR